MFSNGRRWLSCCIILLDVGWWSWCLLHTKLLQIDGKKKRRRVRRKAEPIPIYEMSSRTRSRAAMKDKRHLFRDPERIKVEKALCNARVRLPRGYRTKFHLPFIL